MTIVFMMVLLRLGEFVLCNRVPAGGLPPVQSGTVYEGLLAPGCDEKAGWVGILASGGPRSPRFDSTEVQYARLRKEILDGVFAPGTILLETALSAKYGVSRTPVREALVRLAQDGLIERSTRGFRIKQRNPEQILEIYEARIVLEARSAELAAKRRTEFDLARMAHLLDERRAVTDSAQFGPLNDKWHHAMRLSAHNETVSDLLARLDSLLLLYRPRTFRPTADDRSAEEHAVIQDAISRGHEDAAATAMTSHLRRMRDRRIQALLQDDK
jgi:DNA-binding GntR family transcriptional regulator